MVYTTVYDDFCCVSVDEPALVGALEQLDEAYITHGLQGNRSKDVTPAAQANLRKL